MNKTQISRRSLKIKNIFNNNSKLIFSKRSQHKYLPLGLKKIYLDIPLFGVCFKAQI